MRTPSRTTPPPVRVSVLVCAYNEERNIERLLKELLAQGEGPSYRLAEILVIASGCTDQTVPRVRALAATEPRIHLEIQPERRGKASAVREGLQLARGEVVLIENADTVPGPGALEAALREFRDPEVGLVCTHPVPAPGGRGFTAHMADVMWDVHDYVSSMIPKAGEAFAFRQIRVPLPEDIEDDDTFVGMYVGSQGLKSVYARDAVIFNRAASTPRDLVGQRFRIDRQVLGLRRRTGYLTSTWTPEEMGRAWTAYLRAHPREIAWVLALTGLEVLIRIAALCSVAVHHEPLSTWDPIESTKAGIPQNLSPEVRGGGPRPPR
jgi:poly-beta-1,6-N-acetyl-D-glucosamine synthase